MLLIPTLRMMLRWRCLTGVEMRSFLKCFAIGLCLFPEPASLTAKYSLSSPVIYNQIHRLSDFWTVAWADLLGFTPFALLSTLVLPSYDSHHSTTQRADQGKQGRHKTFRFNTTPFPEVISQPKRRRTALLVDTAD